MNEGKKPPKQKKGTRELEVFTGWQLQQSSIDFKLSKEANKGRSGLSVEKKDVVSMD